MNKVEVRLVLKKLKNHENTSNIGFKHGLLGKIISSFIIADIDNHEEYREIGSSSLVTLADSINQLKNLSFRDGLLGIAWGLDWLAQKGHIDIDTEDVLADIEGLIYKDITYRSDNNLSLSNGIIGKAHFFHKRFLNSSNRYKLILYKECLVFLTNDVNYRFFNDSFFDKNSFYEAEKLRTVCEAMLFLSSFHKEEINIHVVENSLYPSIDIVMNSLNRYQSKILQSSEYPKKEIYHYLHASMALLVTSENLNHSFLKDIAYKHIKYILKYLDLTQIDFMKLSQFEIEVFVLLYLSRKNMSFSSSFFVQLAEKLEQIGDKVSDNLKLILYISLNKPAIISNNERFIFLFS